jgi:hypothetical protein
LELFGEGQYGMGDGNFKKILICLRIIHCFLFLSGISTPFLSKILFKGIPSINNYFISLLLQKNVNGCAYSLPTYYAHLYLPIYSIFHDNIRLFFEKFHQLATLGKLI